MLEGLRRLDENISPGVAFPPITFPSPMNSRRRKLQAEAKSEVERSFAPAFLSLGKDGGGRRKPIFIGAVAVAILASVAVIGFRLDGTRAAPATATASAETACTAAAPQSTQAETPRSRNHQKRCRAQRVKMLMRQRNVSVKERARVKREMRRQRWFAAAAGARHGETWCEESCCDRHV